LYFEIFSVTRHRDNNVPSSVDETFWYNCISATFGATFGATVPHLVVILNLISNSSWKSLDHKTE